MERRTESSHFVSSLFVAVQLTEVLTLIQAAQRKVRAIANPEVNQALWEHWEVYQRCFRYPRSAIA
ncbi:hypothetical protein [Leptolyngbya sp. GGD]|nr:hypothetical protein [Leptolyngbya sp. GGD]MCY6488705.1 hypothetical protein [Leptolyngbya sp. GGD]